MVALVASRDTGLSSGHRDQPEDPRLVLVCVCMCLVVCQDKYSPRRWLLGLSRHGIGQWQDGTAACP